MASILVIDDDRHVRALLRAALEGDGHSVHDASDGKEGLALYRREPADLILCDIFMPGQDGLATLRELRRDFPAARVVAMSGGSPIAHRDFLPLANLLGAFRALEKPIPLQRLRDTVREALRDPGP